MIHMKNNITENKKVVLYADNAMRLTCSRCGQKFVSRGIKDMALSFTSFGEPTYVPREDVVCYNCEAEDKYVNARVIGGPVGE